MKVTTTVITLLTCTFSLIAMAVANSGQDYSTESSVLERSYVPTSTFIQDTVSPPIPLAPAMPVPVSGNVVDQGQSVMVNPVVTYSPVYAAPVGNGCCQTCSRKRCRGCKPEPVPVLFCLVDPCGCTHEACVEVPVCCLGQQPVVTWRDGVLDRQVATLCWACCDHKAKVIVTHCGKIRVRD